MDFNTYKTRIAGYLRTTMLEEPRYKRITKKILRAALKTPHSFIPIEEVYRTFIEQCPESGYTKNYFTRCVKYWFPKIWVLNHKIGDGYVQIFADHQLSSITRSA
jgi:hypothetical protein